MYCATHPIEKIAKPASGLGDFINHIFLGMDNIFIALAFL